MTTQTPDLAALTRQLDSMEEQLRQMRSHLEARQPAAEGGAAPEHPYITHEPSILQDEPIIRGTRTPVRAVVEHWTFGDAPETIVRKLPHLRLAQVFDALSYYDDHRVEIERYIAANRVPVDD